MLKIVVLSLILGLALSASNQQFYTCRTNCNCDSAPQSDSVCQYSVLQMQTCFKDSGSGCQSWASEQARVNNKNLWTSDIDQNKLKDYKSCWDGCSPKVSNSQSNGFKTCYDACYNSAKSGTMVLFYSLFAILISALFLL